jgi:hypothetical protein
MPNRETGYAEQRDRICRTERQDMPNRETGYAEQGDRICRT